MNAEQLKMVQDLRSWDRPVELKNLCMVTAVEIERGDALRAVAQEAIAELSSAIQDLKSAKSRSELSNAIERVEKARGALALGVK